MKRSATIAVVIASVHAASAAPTAQVVFSFKRAGGEFPLSAALERGNAYFLSLFSGGRPGCLFAKHDPYPCGTIMKLLPPNAQHATWRGKDIYRFQPTPADGGLPVDGPVAYDHGNLLLTTAAGGTQNYGTLVELFPPTTAGAAWTEQVVYDFGTGPLWGPLTRPYLDGKGNVFATVSGGANIFGGVAELSPPVSGQGTWTETVIHLFDSTNDGSNPDTGIRSDAQGNLFLTTELGGRYYHGTAVELSPPTGGGSVWTETVLHTFTGGSTDGGNPSSGLTADASGNFYGLTSVGGAANQGTAYELSPPSGGGTQWTVQVLYSFTGGADGGTPVRGLSRDAAGNIFVTATKGGDPTCQCGTLVELSPPQSGQGAYTETTLHSFTGTPDGASPSEITVEDNGNFLVPTQNGGQYSAGALIEVTNTGYVVKR